MNNTTLRQAQSFFKKHHWNYAGRVEDWQHYEPDCHCQICDDFRKWYASLDGETRWLMKDSNGDPIAEVSESRSPAVIDDEDFFFESDADFSTPSRIYLGGWGGLHVVPWADYYPIAAQPASPNPFNSILLFASALLMSLSVSFMCARHHLFLAFGCAFYAMAFAGYWALFRAGK